MGFDSGTLEGAKGFLKMDDLEGRLLVISPLSKGERDSDLPGQQGKKYDYIVCDIIVCDGDEDDRIGDSIPGQLDSYQLAGQSIVGQLEGKIGKGRLVVGRLTKKPAQRKGFSPAWFLSAPEPNELKLAQESILKMQTESAGSPFDDD